MYQNGQNSFVNEKSQFLEKKTFRMKSLNFNEEMEKKPSELKNCVAFMTNALNAGFVSKSVVSAYASRTEIIRAVIGIIDDNVSFCDLFTLLLWD